MAKVDYVAPVEALHGKLSKKDKIGFAKRQFDNAQGEQVKYTTTYGKRSTPVTAAEINFRRHFGAVGAACAARLKDDTKKAADRLGFMQQSQYKTMRQYVWHACETELANS